MLVVKIGMMLTMFVSCTVQTKVSVAVVKQAWIERLSDADLRTYLATIKAKGYRLQPADEATNTLLRTRVTAVAPKMLGLIQPVSTITKVIPQQNKKVLLRKGKKSQVAAQNAPTGGAKKSEGAVVSGAARALPLETSTAPHAPASTQGVSTSAVPSQAPGAPTIPAAPVMQPAPGIVFAPPSAPPVAPPLEAPHPVEEKAVQKPVGKPASKTGLLEPLSADELQNLTDKERVASDAVVMETIAAIARESFSGPQGALYTVGTKSFTNSFEAYCAFVIEQMSKLGTNPAFKKRAELAALIGPDMPGSISRFVAENITKQPDVSMTEFLTTFLQNVQSGALVDNTLVNIINPCVFNVASITGAAHTPVRTIVINLGVSQRIQQLNPSPADQVSSDGSVIDKMHEFIAAVRSQLPPESESASLKTGKEPEAATPAITLSQDYVEVLRSMIDMLRLEPDFLKFSLLLGSQAQAVANSKGSPLEKIKLTPLLIELQSTDQSLFTLNTLLSPMSAQLVFDATEFTQVVRSGAREFKAVFEDHRMRLAQQKGEVDVLAFLVDRLEKATKIKDIRDTIAMLPGMIGNRPEIQLIQKQLHSLDPDVDQIFAQLNALTQRALPERIENIVRTTLAAYKQEKVVARQALDILGAAKKEAQDKKIYVGDVIINRLQQEVKHALSAADKRKLDELQGLYSTPASVQALYVRLVGSKQDVDAYATTNDFYTMIDPYGLLLMVVRDVQAEGERLDAKQRMALLIDSLTSLNEGKQTPNRSYVATIGTESALINAGVYKDTLTPMINALQSGDIDKVVHELDTLVSNAHLGVEHSQAYTQLRDGLRTLLLTTITDLVVNQIASLNSGKGEATIQGLPLEKVPFNEARRNASIYKALQGQFQPLVALLMPKGVRVDFAAVQADAVDAACAAVITNIEQRIVADAAIKWLSPLPAQQEKNNVIGLLRTYLMDTLKKQLMNVITVARSASGIASPSAEPSSEFGGVPEAPALEGEVPAAPPL